MDPLDDVNQTDLISKPSMLNNPPSSMHEMDMITSMVSVHLCPTKASIVLANPDLASSPCVGYVAHWSEAFPAHVPTSPTLGV